MARSLISLWLNFYVDFFILCWAWSQVLSLMRKSEELCIAWIGASSRHKSWWAPAGKLCYYAQNPRSLQLIASDRHQDQTRTPACLLPPCPSQSPNPVSKEPNFRCIYRWYSSDDWERTSRNRNEIPTVKSCPCPAPNLVKALPADGLLGEETKSFIPWLVSVSHPFCSLPSVLFLESWLGIDSKA